MLGITRCSVLALLVAGLVACSSGESQSQVPSDKHSGNEGFHQSLLTVDTHIDIPSALGTIGADFRKDGPMQVDIPKMRAGGLDAGFFIVYVSQGPVDDAGYNNAYEQAQDKFKAINRMLDNSPDDLALVTSPEQLRAVVANGQLAVAIGVENAYPLGRDLQHLQEFYDRGARYISLTHFGHNHFADSSVAKGEQHGVAEPENQGLSDTGKRLIREMNRLGIMVDVSHTSRLSTMAAVKLSQTPVIASHSSVQAVYDHPRNLSDQEIKAIAAKGGVIQAVAFDAYMRARSEANQQAITDIRTRLDLLDAEWYKRVTETERRDFRDALADLHDQFPRATIVDFVDHIDYIVELVGIRHVGIATDFGGGGGIHGWDRIDQTPAVTEELRRRGYSKADIQRIWGGNLLRVWSEVEAYAKANR